MITRLVTTLLLLAGCTTYAVADGRGLPDDAWRALPERSLSGSTLPLRITLLPADTPAPWLDNPATKVMSPIARALADEQDRGESELKRRSEKRIEVLVGSDRLQFKLRRNGLVMRAKFD